MPEYKSFPLPDTAEGLTEAEILSWHVKPGDVVVVNQIIVEIETAKAAVELPCPWAGVVTELHVHPGQTVDVGTPILTVDVDPGGAAAPDVGSINGSLNGSAVAAPAEEEMKPLVGYGSKAVTAKRRARRGPAVPAEPAAAAAQGSVAAAFEHAPGPLPVGEEPASANTATAASAVSAAAVPNALPAAPDDQPGGYVPLAKPPVRKLAKELGVDLRSLAGSGDRGVITRSDVEQAAAGPVAEAPTEVPAARAVASSGGERRVPIKGVRKVTAAAMVSSAFTAPHVTEFLTVDVTPMMELRARLRAHRDFRDVKLTPLAFCAKAVAMAVKRTPEVNSAWDEAAQEIVYKDYVHLGIAAATPRGLIVPKVRDAERLSLRELAEALDALTVTARDGKTPPADMVNGTITITNVGVFGVDTGTPIINPGESAILAFGAIRDTPWVVDGEVVVRKVCQLALSFDHRLVDGQQGSEFLSDVGALLADPAVAMTY
ncbi:Dihydrolipoamide acetyltransferase component of pyruvate dehydrogenase complex [Actinokineospora spheciospongiae]|uniref:Dihydrolipoamide acetyltransferase component of pyruvate dehydrogenase complex n=1 Tax=Actinokineospora spheciospongiae TaxID=909613 RepID=W7IPK5_9PSEU|nr:dihydrolipoamide acetyltransferase family protein [Actinokineospora spheciospongiae]EWC58471.1 Dihydrolipoamide acetyltransferase component of pyruvate dehydrogenase complex [Actinokineospora spheciospongiae]